MIRVALLLVVLALAAGCGGSERHSTAARPARTITDVHDIAQLRTAFNTASGEPRLIVIASPT